VREPLPHQRPHQRSGDLPLSVILRSFTGLFFSYVITDLLISSQLPAAAKVNSFEHFIEIYLHGILAES